MLKLLHYDLMFHFASLVVTFLVKVTFWAINFVSSHPLSPLPPDYNDQSNIFFCAFSLGLQSWTKVLGHFCVSGAFSNSHRSNPSPHPANNVGRVYPEFFRVSTLHRVGGGRTSRKFRKGCTVLRGNREMTEKYEYCSTVSRTFVQDWFDIGLS